MGNSNGVPPGFNSSADVAADGTVSYPPRGTRSTVATLSRHPLSPQHPYFEVLILATGAKGTISIGLARKDYRLTRQPGALGTGVCVRVRVCARAREAEGTCA